MKLLLAIKRALGLTPAERIDNAIYRASNLAADAAKHETRARLYNAALAHIDPHQDWNVFAHFKQKCYDAEEEAKYWEHRVRLAREDAKKLIDENIAPAYVNAVLLQETAR